MKRIMQLSLALVAVAVMMLSCNKNTPKDVAYTWLTGFNHMDFDAAKKLSTNDTKNLLSELEQLTDKVSDSNKKDLKKIVITIKNVQQTGDKAVATYISSDNPAKEQTINLVKQDNKWLVQFSKIDLMGGVPSDKIDEPAGPDGAPDSTGSEVPDTSRH